MSWWQASIFVKLRDPLLNKASNVFLSLFEDSCVPPTVGTEMIGGKTFYFMEYFLWLANEEAGGVFWPRGLAFNIYFRPLTSSLSTDLVLMSTSMAGIF